MTDVDHARLFKSEFSHNDVGVLRPRAKELLDRLRKAGKTIRITGSITETPHGRRALLSALYDHELQFDEIANA